MEEEVLTSAESGKFLTVSCYDEEPQHQLNTIFVKIDGFAEYVTLSIKNNFSVYKMPKFKIAVPSDGFELLPYEEPKEEVPIEEQPAEEEAPKEEEKAE